MSDSHEEHPEDPHAPEGMEARQRRVRKRRKRPKKKEDAKSVIERGKALLEKMQQQEEFGHVGVAEQVRRLQKDEDDDRPLDDVWGTKKRSTTWLWVSLFCIIIPLVGAGLGYKYFFADRPNATADVDFTIEDLPGFEEMDGEIDKNDWFGPASTEYLKQAREILRVVNEATTVEDIERHLRPSPHRDKNPVKVGYWDSPFLVKNINRIAWEPFEVEIPNDAGAAPRQVLKVTGLRADQSRFAAYFVKEGHEFLLDWDATTGWSEMPLAQIRLNKSSAPKTIRCLLKKKAIFDRQFDGVKHSGYVLGEPDTGEFLFAYVPLADEASEELDGRLKDVLQYGRFVMALKHDLPVVVTVRATESGRFEIVDFKHESWVAPHQAIDL